MASAKQIAWRKKFARMSKAGKFKKSKKSSSTPKKSNPHQDAHVASYDDAWKGERDYFYRPIRTKGSEKTRAKLKKGAKRNEIQKSEKKQFSRCSS